MSKFVLSIVSPAEGDAKYGKAWISRPLEVKSDLRTPAHTALRRRNPHMTIDEASRYAGQIVAKDPGAVSVESSTGLLFRIDTEENAPHLCPCCGRLVLRDDHRYADTENAHCLGCFTWEVDAPPHLPENSAHSTTDQKEKR